MKLKIYSFKNVKSTNDTALRFIKKNIILLIKLFQNMQCQKALNMQKPNG